MTRAYARRRNGASARLEVLTIRVSAEFKQKLTASAIKANKSLGDFAFGQLELVNNQKPVNNLECIMQQTVPAIVKDQINKLSAMIQRYGEFKIRLNDGTEYGNLLVQDPKQKSVRKTMVEKNGYGTRTAYIRSFIDKLTESGDVVEIPLGPYTRKDLRGAVSAACSAYIGLNAYTVESTATGFTVLRF